ncbi:MAG: roadblock/LC7 domain-containing protein [Verrucomicrobiota bacterium]
MARFLLKFNGKRHVSHPGGVQPGFMSKTVKTRFVGLLRGLLRRLDDYESNEEAEAPRPIAVAPSTVTASSTAAESAMASVPAQSNTAFARPAARPEEPDELQIPLSGVLATLPVDLRGKIMQPPLPGACLSVSVEKILSQLAHGSVKISFGELRAAAPNLFVNSGGESDSRPVTLPLNEILARLNPALLARRTSQKRVEVGGDITGPFDGRGKGITFTTTPLKPNTPPPLHPRVNDPVSWPPLPPHPLAPPLPQRPSRATTVTPATGTTPSRTALLSPSVAGTVPPRNGVPKSTSAAPVPPMTMAAPAALPEQAQPTILAPLAALAEEWPEALRLEISQSGLAGAQVALPLHLVEPPLKRGRVIFSWRYVRSWIKPMPAPTSIHDGLELELPLKVLAPLFFARQKAARQQRKVSLSSDIPNLFFGFPQPQAPPPEAPAPKPEVPRPALKPVEAKSSDTNFYLWGDNGEAPRSDDTEYKRPVAPATDFANRRAMPRDVVSRAVALPGVAGAVVALQDGLNVASQVPAGMNGDTLAAFLPQIFDRLGQSTRELRMGSLNNVNFTVGNVPWKIFRVSAVYFAAFGHPGEPLPTAQLAALAAELERKKP